MIELGYKGRSLEAMRAEPQTVNFGSIATDSPAKTVSVKLRRGDGGPLAPEIGPPRSSNITTELHEIQPGEQYELAVTISPPWPNQRVFDTVMVKTGVPEAPMQTVQIVAQIEPRLKSQPPRFTIPPNVPNEVELKSTLVWSGGEPGHILSISVSDPTLSVRVQEEDEWPVVVLTVPAQYAPKERTASFVLLTTDDQTASELRIPVLVMTARAPTMRPPYPPPGGAVPSDPFAPTSQPGEGMWTRPGRVPPAATQPSK